MADEAPPNPLTPADVTAAVTAAVAAATAPLTAKITELEGTVVAAADAPPPQPEYTRAELGKAVEDGKITEIQAQDILDKQNDKKTANLVKETVSTTIGNINRDQTVDSQIDAYSKLMPEVLAEGSDERQRVASQFSYFVSIGLPNDKSTELAALNSVYGSIDALKSSKGAAQEFDTQQETSGGGAPAETVSGTTLKLSADERKHYQYLIDRGQYKDWKEVEAEMKFSNKQVRSRHGRAA